MTNMYQKLRLVLPSAALLAVAIFVFPIFQTLVVNIDDFPAPLNFFWESRSAQLAAFGLGLLALPSLFLSPAAAKIYGGALLAICIAFYIQGNVFVWEYGVVDGAEFDFSGKGLVAGLEVIFWVTALIGGVVFGAYLFENRRMLIALILAAQFLGIAVMPGSRQLVANILGASPPSPTESQMAEKLEQVSAVSSDKNVVLWISDGLQSDVTERILKTTPQLARHFEGFTFFSDAMGQYRLTKVAIPMLVSGKTFYGQMNYHDFIEKEVMRDNIGRIAASAGIAANMVSSSEFCAGFVECNFYWHLMPNPSFSSDQELIANTLNISYFRLTPHIAKAIVFDGERGVGQYLVSVLLGFDYRRTTQTNDVYFFNQLTDALHVEDMPQTLKVFHSKSSHHPYTLGKDCRFKGGENTILGLTKQYHCNISLLTDFIKKLKMLGVYDQTLIIWVADHGSRRDFAMIESGGEYSREISESSVTFAVKPIAAPRSVIEYSDAPVQTVDIAPTVLEALGLPYDRYVGRPVSDVKGNDRVRRYFSSTAPWRSKAVEFYEYDVAGARLDPENWKPSGVFKIENHN